MTEERKHAILFAATLLCARMVQPYLECEGTNCLTELLNRNAPRVASQITPSVPMTWCITKIKPDLAQLPIVPIPLCMREILLHGETGDFPEFLVSA